VEFPWDQVHFATRSHSNITKNRAAKLLKDAIELSIDFDLLLSSNGYELELSKRLYWKNFDTDTFIDAKFSATLGFEDVQFDDMPANPSFSLWGEIALLGEDDNRLFTIEENREYPNSFGIVKTACRQFAQKLASGLNHPDLKAPFGLIQDLPYLQNVNDHDIFEVTHIDHDGEVHEDQICYLRRSIYSMPETGGVKWIRAYSRKQRSFIEIKVSNFEKFQILTASTTVSIFNRLFGSGANKKDRPMISFPWLQ